MRLWNVDGYRDSQIFRGPRQEGQRRICYFNPAVEERPTGGQTLASVARHARILGGLVPATRLLLLCCCCCHCCCMLLLLLLFDSGCRSSGKADEVTGEMKQTNCGRYLWTLREGLRGWPGSIFMFWNSSEQVCVRRSLSLFCSFSSETHSHWLHSWQWTAKMSHNQFDQKWYKLSVCFYVSNSFRSSSIERQKREFAVEVLCLLLRIIVLIFLLRIFILRDCVVCYL